MPLWRVYHPDSVLTDVKEREALAKAITKIYTDLELPGFYVGVIFSAQPEGTIFKSGEVQPSSTRPPFIRIVWTNIAGGFEGVPEEVKRNFIKKIDDALWPFLGAKGWDFEHHGEDADVTLGRIQGYEFPPRHSELEKFWAADNEPKPLPK